MKRMQYKSNNKDNENFYTLLKRTKEISLKQNDLFEDINKEMKKLFILVTLFIIEFSTYLFIDYYGYYIGIEMSKIQYKYNDIIFHLKDKNLNLTLFEVSKDIYYWFSKTDER